MTFESMQDAIEENQHLNDVLKDMEARAEKAEADASMFREARDMYFRDLERANAEHKEKDGKNAVLTEALEALRVSELDQARMASVRLIDKALANTDDQATKIMAVVEAAISYRTNLKSGSLIATQQAGDTLDRALKAYEGGE